MRLSVEIDPNAGFCGGVIRAIDSAESFIDGNMGTALYSLGAIVHNEEELSRLREKGLKTISSLSEVPEGSTVLIRAHGEPPSTYETAARSKIKLIDCTCPVVLKLQESIRKAYSEIQPRGGQIIIFGKIGHAEVLGLLGQIGNDATVVENLEMAKEFLKKGIIDKSRPVEVFSQTTKNPEEYSALTDYLSKQGCNDMVVHRTICRQVASRHELLSEFAMNNDVVIFVSGKMSSNGAVLSKLCRSVNPRTYFVESPDEISESWFSDGERVGISGATSTPLWLLKSVKARIELFAR